jgi:hypothetical protein
VPLGLTFVSRFLLLRLSCRHQTRLVLGTESRPELSGIAASHRDDTAVCLYGRPESPTARDLALGLFDARCLHLFGCLLTRPVFRDFLFGERLLLLVRSLAEGRAVLRVLARGTLPA